MPRSLLEPTGTGKPIGTTPFGDIPEAIGNYSTGFWWSLALIAIKIRLLFRNPEVCDIITRNADFSSERNFPGIIRS